MFPCQSGQHGVVEKALSGPWGILDTSSPWPCSETASLGWCVSLLEHGFEWIGPVQCMSLRGLCGAAGAMCAVPTVRRQPVMVLLVLPQPSKSRQVSSAEAVGGCSVLGAE